MADTDTVKLILTGAIKLAHQLVKAGNEAIAFKQECYEIKIKAEKLIKVLEKAVIASSHLCEYPIRRIISKAEIAIQKNLFLVEKCSPKLRNRVLTIISVSSLEKIRIQLDGSITDVLWILNVSIRLKNGEELLGLPPFAINEPILFLIYQHMAILYTGTPDDCCEAARSLGLLASANHRCAQIMIHNGLSSIFVKVLKEGSMKAKAEVAWAISEVITNFPESQNVFAQHNVIRLLLSHLTSLIHQQELEDSHMKAMAARALRELVKGNSSICKSITDSKRFLSFVLLIELHEKEVRYNSLMALMEITAVAEEHSELRSSAFKSNSPVFKVIVNQMYKLIENPDILLLKPYITLIGNLARAFRAFDTLMIEQLVKLLGHQDPEVSKEATLALTKFVAPCNYLHKDHSRAIVEAGGSRLLIELSKLCCEIRIPALEFLVYIAPHVSDNTEVIKLLQEALPIEQESSKISKDHSKGK